MKLKLLTLNCWEFTKFDEIVNFVSLHNPDIITFQEASTIPILLEGGVVEMKFENYIHEFKNLTGYDFIFAPSWGVIDNDGIKQGKGLAIFYNNNVKLIDYFSVDFKNYLEYTKYYSIDEEPLRKATSKKERYLLSWKKPLNYLTALFQVDGKFLKLLTTQLCISYFCTETLQRIQQSTEIADFIKNSNDIPIIITGDFNIQSDSQSILDIVNSGMELATGDLTNTLDENIHPIFDPKRVMEGSVSTGYAVDHILTKKIDNLKLETFQKAGISDHIPLILEFEI